MKRYPIAAKKRTKKLKFNKQKNKQKKKKQVLYQQKVIISCLN